MMKNSTSQGRTVVAVDLGGTRFRVAAITERGAMLQRIGEPTPVEEGPAAVMERLYAAVRKVLEGCGGEPTAIAVAAPGPLNPWTGVLYSPPNLPGWDIFPLKETMERDLGRPVFVGNDANLAALGEYRFGAGRGLSDMVYVTVSTGIGGGVIAGGRLLLGASGLAGEIGHTVVVSDGPLCGCGNHGCLESLSSGTAIGRRARTAVEEGNSTTMLGMVGGDLSLISAEVVEQAARNGDELASSILSQAAQHLGIGVANVVHLFNPQMVVIGGGVSRAGSLLLQPVWDEVARRVMAPFRVNLRIVLAQLGDDAGLLGCAALAFPRRASAHRDHA